MKQGPKLPELFDQLRDRLHEISFYDDISEALYIVTTVIVGRIGIIPGSSPGTKG